MQQCLFCGPSGKIIHVLGLYQCSVCHTYALPCCDGDICETNYFFRRNENDQPSFPHTTGFDKKEEILKDR